LKRYSAVRFSLIETKLSDLAIGKAQLKACAFSDGVEKQKCCLGPGDIKTVITFLLYNFLIPNLAGCFVPALATVSVIFKFSHFWNRHNKLSKSKNRQSTLVSECFFSPIEKEKLFDFDFHKLHNMSNVFVQNLGFYRARFSI